MTEEDTPRTESQESREKRAQRLQKIHDSGRNLIPEAELDPVERPTSLLSALSKDAGADPVVPPGGEPPAPSPQVSESAVEEPLRVPPTMIHAPPPSPFAMPPTRRYDSGRTPSAPRVPVPAPRRSARRFLPGWKRLRKVLLVLAVLLLALRVIVGFTLGFILDGVTREILGLECRVQSSSLRLLSGEVVFEGLELALPGGKTIASARRVEAAIAWTDLPTLVVHRALMEDLRITLRREVDGSIPALVDVLRLASKPAPAKKTGVPRVLLETVRVNHAALAWEDASRSPIVRESVELDLRGDNLATYECAEPAFASLRLVAPGLVDSCRIDIAARPWNETARVFELELAFEGHPGPLAAYLGAHARPDAQSLQLDLRARFVARPILLEGNGSYAGDLTVERVSLKADQDEIGFDRLVVSARRIGPDGIEISNVACDRPRARFARLADGALAFSGFAFLPREDDPTPGPAAPGATLPPISVDEIAVHGGRFRFQDATTTVPVDLLAQDLEVHVLGLAHDATRQARPAQVDASVVVANAADAIAVVGTVVAFGPKRSASLDLTARGLTLRAIEPYLARVGLASDLASGKLGAHLDLLADADAKGHVTIDGSLANVVLEDGTERFGFGEIKLAHARIDGARSLLEVGSVAVARPRARLRRDARGVTSGAGLRFVAPGSAEVAPVASAHPKSIQHVTVGRVAITDAALSWHDEALGSPLDLGLADGQVTLDGIAYDASGSGAPIREPARLTARARLTPGVAQLSLEASVVADPGAPALSGTLAVTGLTPGPLAPYLSSAGIDPLVERATLDAHVAASARVDTLALRDIHVQISGARLVAPGKDGFGVRLAEELAAIDQLELAGGHVDVRARNFHLGSVTVDGIRGRVVREATGGILALGLRFRPQAPGAIDSPSPDEVVLAPRVHWGEIVLRRAAFAWIDEAVQPYASVRVLRLDASLGALAFDHEDHGGAPPLERTAPFRLHAEIEGAVASLDLVGGIVPSARTPALFADLHATGVTLVALAPYLAGAGMAPGLESGEVEARVEGAAQIGRGGVDASFLVKNVTVSDRHVELAGIDTASFGVRYDRGARTLEVTPAAFQRPRLLVQRTSSGELSLVGLTLTRRAPAVAPAPALERAPGAFLLRGVNVQDLALAWQDELEGVSLDLAHGSLELGEAHVGLGAEPARCRIHADVAAVGAFDLGGVVQLDGTAPAVSVTLALTHLRGGKLTPYFHGSGALLLEDGSLEARLTGSLGTSPEGGRTLFAAIEDLKLDEHGRRILSWSSLRADVRRLDLAANAYVIDEVALEGLEGEAARLADGTLRVAGLELRPHPTVRPPVVAPVDPTAPEGETAEGPIPYVVVRSISAAITRFAFHDWTSLAKAPTDPEAGPPPFVFEDARLAQFRPFVLASDPASAIFQGGASLTIPGVANRVVGSLQLVPFDSEPHAVLQLELDGISGPALVARAPELAARWDLSAIPQGSLHGTITLDLRNRRRIDVLMKDIRAQPLAFEITVTDVIAKSSPDGPVLAGCDELHVDVASLDPRTGETRIRAIELTNPRGRVRREAGGIRFLDALWRAGPETLVETGAPAPTSPEAAEVRIDRIALLDGDVLLEDATVSPEASLQLGALEVELTGTSSRALDEPRPFRLRLGARGGTFFDEVTAHGVLQLRPLIEGDVTVTITGIKGGRVAGYTKKDWLGLDVKDGRIDLDFRATFRNGVMKSVSHVILTELQVEELPGTRASGIKAAIATLRDDDGVVNVPPIPVERAFDEHLHPVGDTKIGVTFANALGAAVHGLTGMLKPFEGIGESIKKAVAGSADDETRRSHRVSFAAADARLPDSANAELDVLAAKLKADTRLRASLRAEVGTSDEERAKKLSAPTPGERRDLIARLEARRTKLERVRADSDAEVRAALLAGSDALGPARARYAQAARVVQEVDRTLDGLYDQEREGRARTGERRASEVMESVCEARVEAVRSYLVRQGVPVEQLRALRSRLRAGTDAESTGRVQIDVTAAAAR